MKDTMIGADFRFDKLASVIPVLPQESTYAKFLRVKGVLSVADAALLDVVISFGWNALKRFT